MNLDSLRWTIAGVSFLYAYEWNRSQKSTPISGWRYLTTLVLISILLAEVNSLIIGIIFSSLSIKEVTGLPYLCMEIFLSALIGYQSSRITSTLKKDQPHDDPFINFCQSHEGKVIFLTLKNGKIYAGVLIEYPVDTSLHSQHIVILPITSGYRDTLGEANWKTSYPKNQDEKSKLIRLIISKDQIITITPWVETAEFEELQG